MISKKYALHEICTNISYGYTASAITQNIGPKFLRITDIQNGIVDWNTVPYCEIKKSDIEKYSLCENDIVVARTGNSTGENYLYNGQESTVFASYLIRFRVNIKIADPYYVWMFMRSKYWWNYVDSIKTGSAQLGANAKVLGEFTLSLPLLEIQQKISRIFFNINKKIEKNNEINQTLETMAQAIFKSWFVDFDPVHAKAKAKLADASDEEINLAAMRVISSKTDAELEEMTQKSPAEYENLKTTASYFPDEFEESELGQIPRGWKVSTIGEEYNITMGQSPKGESYNEGQEGTLFFQGRAEFGWRYPTPRLYTTDPKRMANKGDVLMSVRAPVGDFNVALEDCCIGRGLASLKHKSGSQTYSFYHLLSLKPELDRYNGEGTVFGSINQTNLKNIVAITPDKVLINAFINKLSAFDNKIENNSEENITLINLRDTLLPKLLSGELVVNG